MNTRFTPGAPITKFGSFGPTIQNTRTPSNLMSRIASAKGGSYGLSVSQDTPSFFGLGTTERGVPTNGAFRNRATRRAMMTREERDAEDLRLQQQAARQNYSQLKESWENGPLGQQFETLLSSGRAKQAFDLYDRVQMMFMIMGNMAGIESGGA